MEKSFIGLCLISIHALREEGDHTRILLAQTGSYFYPRPPRGGRRVGGAGRQPTKDISIHALREEGDEGNEKPKE